MTLTIRALGFAKYQGAGNDFILISEIESLPAEKIRQLCSRQYGVGADGVAFVSSLSSDRLIARFFNSDGSEAMMCGNALRCIAAEAFEKSGTPLEKVTITLGGKNYVCFLDQRGIRIKMPQPRLLREGMLSNSAYQWVDTGTSHVVMYVDQEKLKAKDFAKQCEPVSRDNKLFAPDGANINWAYTKSRSHIQMRTYEKGVYAETLACGSGAAAVVYACLRKGCIEDEVCVEFITSGEKLWYQIVLDEMGSLAEWFMIGQAKAVFTGTITL